MYSSDLPLSPFDTLLSIDRVEDCEPIRVSMAIGTTAREWDSWAVVCWGQGGNIANDLLALSQGRRSLTLGRAHGVIPCR